MSRRRGELAANANWHTPAFAIVAADDPSRVELAESLFRASARRVALAFLRADEGTLPACIDAAARHRYRTLARTLERSPYVSMRVGLEGWEAALDGKLRSELRRRRRRLEEQGTVELDLRDGSEGLDGLLEEGFRIEAAAWKGARGTAIAADPAARVFYDRAARWAAERGWLRLAFLRLDGRALAFDLCLEQGGAHALLKTGFEPELRQLAPGLLLREAMIRRAFELGLDSYEFLGSDEPWKLAWTGTVRELKLLQAFAPTLPGTVDRLAWAAGRPAAKRILALGRR